LSYCEICDPGCQGQFGAGHYQAERPRQHGSGWLEDRQGRRPRGPAWLRLSSLPWGDCQRGCPVLSDWYSSCTPKFCTFAWEALPRHGFVEYLFICAGTRRASEKALSHAGKVSLLAGKSGCACRQRRLCPQATDFCLQAKVLVCRRNHFSGKAVLKSGFASKK